MGQKIPPAAGLRRRDAEAGRADENGAKGGQSLRPERGGKASVGRAGGRTPCRALAGSARERLTGSGQKGARSGHRGSAERAPGDAVEVGASPRVARFAQMWERDYFYRTLMARLVPRQ
jgi:hypothetical protein